MPRKTGSHGQITGPRIREVALRLFARHGYAAVSMRQIAREVGVQAGALYTYTPDKQALLADLMRAHMAHLLESWDAEDKPDAPLPRLEHFTRFHIAYHLDRPDEVFVSYMELRNLEPGNFAEIERMRRAYEAELESILRAGAAARAFAVTDTRLASMALIAMLTGVGTWYREGGRLRRSEVADIYWEMVRGSVGATPPGALRPEAAEAALLR
jgi:AcrR family transcriptional regulator